MDLYRRRHRSASVTALYLALSATLMLIGCASPGPPRAPSLKLPQPVRDLTVTRVGDTVELHFTAPANSTDKLPLRGQTLSGQFCRQLPHQPCLPVSPQMSIPLPNPNKNNNLITWIDPPPTRPNHRPTPAPHLPRRVLQAPQIVLLAFQINHLRRLAQLPRL